MYDKKRPVCNKAIGHPYYFLFCSSNWMNTFSGRPDIILDWNTKYLFPLSHKFLVQ